MLIETQIEGMIFMKRITKVLSVIICLMMVIGLLLPMGGVASAARTVPITNAADLSNALAPGTLQDGDILNFKCTKQTKSADEGNSRLRGRL